MTRFSKINRKNAEDYNPHYQRHHLIPLQVGTLPDVSIPLNTEIVGGFDFNDFDRNGVLLPSDEQLALETGRPLHRGPHPRYNELVIDRLLLIIRLSEQIKSRNERQTFFRFRVNLLQATLRHVLLGSGLSKLRLNKRDPGPSAAAFRELDACVDILSSQTQWPPVK
ncbi:MAG: AHH domain-containing protein [Parasphingorhabdus sp.]|uniref:AHH domain-containing protein n=1 Tax=Parasphingorhabdus sp. TaxID=2709688 RepID=UPI003296EA7B